MIINNTLSYLIINYLNKFTNQILWLAVKGWIRNTNNNFIINKYSSYDITVPNDIPGIIVNFIGKWFEITDSMGNTVLDELVWANKEDTEIYNYMRINGSENSKKFMQNNVLSLIKNSSIHSLSSYYNKIMEILNHDNEKIDFNKRKELYNNNTIISFLKEIIKNKDYTLLDRSLRCFSKDLKNEEGEDLLHYAFSEVKDYNIVNRLLSSGYNCPGISNNTGICSRNIYRKEPIDYEMHGNQFDDDLLYQWI